jgi:hypothetical protein
MKKVLFTIQPHSVIDVITNSSSELFVGTATSKKAIVELVEGVYPNYLDEYEEIKATHELTNDELDTYISYKYHSWSNEKQEIEKNLIPGFKFDEMYEKTEEGSWRDYQMKKNHGWNFVYSGNREKIIKGIDPTNTKYFMFSIEENPNWEMQEELWSVMDRFHLG